MTMITRIEVDGFKSFRNFAIDLQPFQVLIGPNGAGKSNLFDAITLLSHLAGDNTLYKAFRQSRGDIGELFTILPGGQRIKQMSFAVEMLIGKQVTDTFGVTANVSSTRLRYELHIECRTERGFEKLYINRESLRPITGDDDKWFKSNIPAQKRNDWIVRKRREAYISTDPVTSRIYKHQDRRSGKKQETPLGKIERTILSSVASAEYPTAYAARQEMISWRLLQLIPQALRTPSSIYDPTDLLSDGSNLAAVLYRMSHENKSILSRVSGDMANIVPGILDISIRALTGREELLIEATAPDSALFSSHALSEGTLRILTIVTLKNDPTHQGVICFEEPENGVHPGGLQNMVAILQSMTTNFMEDQSETVRQVLVNTHSPALLNYVEPSNLLFVHMATEGVRTTQMSPITVNPKLFPDDTSSRKYAIHEVMQYLNPKPFSDKYQSLEQL
jgi:predicted ATPase